MSMLEITIFGNHSSMGRNLMEIPPASRNMQMSNPEDTSALLVSSQDNLDSRLRDLLD